jgi:hypothetical protein
MGTYIGYDVIILVTQIFCYASLFKSIFHIYVNVIGWLRYCNICGSRFKHVWNSPLYIIGRVVTSFRIVFPQQYICSYFSSLLPLLYKLQIQYFIFCVIEWYLFSQGTSSLKYLYMLIFDLSPTSILLFFVLFG